jgi:hypothetical protein
VFDSVNGVEILKDLDNYINKFTYTGDVQELLINEGRREVIRYINSMSKEVKELK